LEYFGNVLELFLETFCAIFLAIFFGNIVLFFCKVFKKICKQETNFLFFGGLVVAIAIEKVNLHQRIALGVMRVSGSKLHRVMAAFMIVTAFLSMWISNTATTAMMLPIAVATVKTICGDEENKGEDSEVDSSTEADRQQDPLYNHPDPNKKPLPKTKSMLTINLGKFGGLLRNGGRSPTPSPTASAAFLGRNNNPGGGVGASNTPINSRTNLAEHRQIGGAKRREFPRIAIDPPKNTIPEIDPAEGFNDPKVNMLI
jgi:hypothetical protein